MRIKTEKFSVDSTTQFTNNSFHRHWNRALVLTGCLGRTIFETIPSATSYVFPIFVKMTKLTGKFRNSLNILVGRGISYSPITDLTKNLPLHILARFPARKLKFRKKYGKRLVISKNWFVVIKLPAWTNFFYIYYTPHIRCWIIVMLIKNLSKSKVD